MSAAVNARSANVGRVWPSSTATSAGARARRWIHSVVVFSCQSGGISSGGGTPTESKNAHVTPARSRSASLVTMVVLPAPDAPVTTTIREAMAHPTPVRSRTRTGRAWRQTMLLA
jgi:hypothetical protein